MINNAELGNQTSKLVREHINSNRKVFFVVGGALSLLGVIALIFPFATTIATKIFVGWLFLLAGGVQIAHSFSIRNWGGFLGNLIVGAIYIFVGGWLAFFTLTGIISLTVLIALTFIMQGLLEIWTAIRVSKESRWVWLAFAGVISIVVGVLIINQLPSSALWAIGLLVGIKLLTTGIAFILLPVSYED